MTLLKFFKSFLFLIFLVFISFSAQAAPMNMPTTSLVSFESESDGVNVFAPAAEIGGQVGFGDLNCDGEKDIIISSSTYQTLSPFTFYLGRIYIFFGGSNFSGNYNLANADVILTGANDYDSIGGVLTVDIDETDGCDDLIVVGAGGANRTTDIYLIEGSPAINSQDLDSSLYTNLIHSNNQNEHYSYLHSLGPLDGDYNGDGTINGLDDYLAFCSSVTVKCYLMAVDEMTSTTGTMEELSSFYVFGASEYAITSGDIDEDGFHDLIVGNSTRVGIFFGPVSSSPSLQPIVPWRDLNLQFLTTNWDEENYQGKDIKIQAVFTGQEAFGGDVGSGNIIKISQNENYDDIIISSLHEDSSLYTESGRYHVLSGESIKNLRDLISTTDGITLYADEVTTTPDPNDANNFVTNYNLGSVDVVYYAGGGVNAHYGLAYNHAANSDVNNDGLLDFIAGGSGFTSSTLAGRVNVICGGDMQTLFGNEEILNTTFNTSEVYMDGPANNAGFGSIVVSGADVTGDGIQDTLIAAGGYNNGTVYLVPGSDAEDFDGDGFSVAAGDCNEALSSVYPGAVEVLNEFDENCDGIVDNNLPSYDDDGDGTSEDAGDCDDANININPSATEVCSDGLDNNCDGVFLDCNDVDNDLDGYTENSGDCDDTNININPSVTEICGDSIDQDCSGTDETCPIDPNGVDDDGDGFSENQNDCDDGNVNINPSAAETCGDGIDQDCSGADLICPADPNDVDDDGDGFSENQNDCDDANPNISPSATEICGDGIDENCDNVDTACPPQDLDGDTFAVDVDCNDNNPTIYPGAPETCGDGIDQDCSGADLICPTDPDTVDDDGDSFTENTGDCDDTDDTVYPGAPEIGDALDNDCDGKYDEALMKVKVNSPIGDVAAGEDVTLNIFYLNNTGFQDFDVQVSILNNSYQGYANAKIKSSKGIPFGKGTVVAMLNPWYRSCGTNNQNCALIGSANSQSLSNDGYTHSFSIPVSLPNSLDSSETYGLFVKIINPQTGLTQFTITAYNDAVRDQFTSMLNFTDPWYNDAVDLLAVVE